jgi:hypothetical protein
MSRFRSVLWLAVWAAVVAACIWTVWWVIKALSFAVIGWTP